MDVGKKEQISFEAEIKQVGMRKLASNDKEIKAIFVTNQLQALELGLVPENKTVKVTVKW